MIGHGDGLTHRGGGQDHGEFLAAITRGDVLALDVLLQRQRNKAQNLIAGEMAVIVVDGLKVIKIDGQDLLVLKESDIIGIVEKSASKKKAA